MNGHRTLAEIWNLASDRLGDDLPSQGETIRLLAQLYHTNALVTDADSDVDDLVVRGTTIRRKEFWANFRSPLAIKLRLWDPERFLVRMIPFVRPIFSIWGLLIWCLVVGAAGVLAVQNWDPLSAGVGDRVLAAENLVVLWLSFPLVKVLHEFGHAFAVKHWGGEIHEMGVMFLVGVPVPYLDASASSAFGSSGQRALVGAAGVIVELFVASIAMFVWVVVEPGTLRAITFNVMLIAGVSSLFFNGNPFLRFDAYYVLSDLLEMPNLGLRANRYWGYWIQKFLFGLRDADNPATAQGESAWLAIYAIGAFVNRLLITLSIALFVASKLFFVGVMIASWSITQFALLPIYRHGKFVLFGAPLRGRRQRALAWTFGSLALLGVLFFLIPAPSWTRAEGVIWAREDSIVRAGTDGELASFRVEPGRWVQAGEALVELVDQELVAEYAIAQANLKASQAQYSLDRTRDRVQADLSRQSLEHATRRLERVEEERRALLIPSPADGHFLVQDPEDWPGRYLRRGEVVGYVLDFKPLVIRVAVPAAGVDRVRNHTERVDVRLSERLGEVLSARIVAEVPAATGDLPSRALSTEGGGSIVLDPTAEGKIQAFEHHFLFDLEVDRAGAPVGIGGRVYIRFAHTPEPVGHQLYRAARRLFLSQFNV